MCIENSTHSPTTQKNTQASHPAPYEIVHPWEMCTLLLLAFVCCYFRLLLLAFAFVVALLLGGEDGGTDALKTTMTYLVYGDNDVVTNDDGDHALF